MFRQWKSLLCCVAASVMFSACNVETYLNQTASFGRDGGDAPAGAPIASGNRGSFQVVIENNTPVRAVFTVGTYDDTDERSTPVFFQFSPDAELTVPNGSATLEGFSNSGVFALPCARVFSVGGSRLVGLIADRPGDLETRIDTVALIDGVGFASADLGGTAEAEADQGVAPAAEALLGVEFNCGSLLTVRLEFDDAGPDPFRIEFDVFAARQQR